MKQRLVIYGFMFVPRDCWVGLYWNKGMVYVCLVPCFPFVFRINPAK
jgi:hypothetical protein